MRSSEQAREALIDQALNSAPRLAREALTLGELIGGGGSGSVEAVMWGGERLYLKRPLPGRDEREGAELIAREALTLSKLQGCRAPQLKALLCEGRCENERLLGLIYAPLEGESLRALRGLKPWSPLEVAGLLDQVLGGLREARGRGVEGHGDLSTRHALVNERGELGLIDWERAWGAHVSAEPPLGLSDALGLATLWLELVTGQRLTPPSAQRQGLQLQGLSVLALQAQGWPASWAEALCALLTSTGEALPLSALQGALWAPTSLLGQGVPHSDTASLKREAQALLCLRR